jgi:hypothetical protein
VELYPGLPNVRGRRELVPRRKVYQVSQSICSCVMEERLNYSAVRTSAVSFLRSCGSYREK